MSRTILPVCEKDEREKELEIDKAIHSDPPYGQSLWTLNTKQTAKITYIRGKQFTSLNKAWFMLL
jgi:hypothetical protein